MMTCRRSIGHTRPMPAWISIRQRTFPSGSGNVGWSGRGLRWRSPRAVSASCVPAAASSSSAASRLRTPPASSTRDTGAKSKWSFTTSARIQQRSGGVTASPSLVIVPLVKVLPVATDILPEGDRGTAGFGSTGETTVTGVPVGAKSLAEAGREWAGPRKPKLAEKLAPIPPPPDDHPHGYYKKTPEGYVLMLGEETRWGAPITTPLPDHTDPDAPELIHLTDEGFEVVLTPSEKPIPTTPPADIHPFGYYQKTPWGYAPMLKDGIMWGAPTNMPLPDHTADDAPEMIFLSDHAPEPIPDPADADPLILESVSWPGGEATLPEGVPMTDSSAVAEALRDLATWITRDHSSEGDRGEGEALGILNTLRGAENDG